jgi:hypothetical protein
VKKRKQSGRSKHLAAVARKIVAGLLKHHTPAAIIDAVHELETGIKKGGRPKDPAGSAAAVFDVIEWRLPQPLRGGGKRSVDSICKQLEQDYEAFTTNCRPTWRALRGMYYRIKKSGRPQAHVAGYYCFGDTVLPMLLTEKPNGTLETAELDLQAVLRIASHVQIRGSHPRGRRPISLIESDAPAEELIKQRSVRRR